MGSYTEDLKGVYQDIMEDGDVEDIIELNYFLSMSNHLQEDLQQKLVESDDTPTVESLENNRLVVEWREDRYEFVVSQRDGNKDLNAIESGPDEGLVARWAYGTLF